MTDKQFKPVLDRLKREVEDERNTSKINMDDDGYVAGVRCGNNHSGNDRLSRTAKGMFECSGCGQFAGAQQVLDTQRGPVSGEKGNGGIYRAR